MMLSELPEFLELTEERVICRTANYLEAKFIQLKKFGYDLTLEELEAALLCILNQEEERSVLQMMIKQDNPRHIP